MDISTFFQEKKTLIIEVLMFIGVVFGCYYGYNYLFTEDPSQVQTQLDTSLLGKNFVTFLSATQSGNISFKDQQFLRSDFVGKLQDYSEVILPTPKRGRLNPFVPYASSRPIR